jgi:hypothetical protein
MLISDLPQMNYQSIRCVYFFFDSNDKLFYVGKAEDLHSRLRSHLIAYERQKCRSTIYDRTCWVPDTIVRWLEVGDGDIEAIESYYIEKFKPSGNRRNGSLRGTLYKPADELELSTTNLPIANTVKPE